MFSQAEVDASIALSPIIQFDEGLDEAIGDAVNRYTDERDRARDVFVGILGHDLRNPLQAISMGADGLLERGDALDGDIVTVVRRMKRASNRMAAMIGDLLDFTRGHLGGGIPIERTTVELRALVLHAVEEIAAAHPDRRIVGATPDADLAGLWDGGRIAQALSNLVGNAIQHGSDPITVELTDEGESVRIEVRNAGVIAADILPTMLQPFHSGRSGHGLGLGLYVVDEIARAHGGRVDVASDVDGGTRIALVLPRTSTLPARPSSE
jgi:signal transduction histidine kinase